MMGYTGCNSVPNAIINSLQHLLVVTGDGPATGVTCEY